MYDEESSNENRPIRYLDERKMNMRRRLPDADFFTKPTESETSFDTANEMAHPNAFGSKKSFVPNLGDIVWESPKAMPFHAYIYLNEEQRPIGYIRIPSYSVKLREGNAKIEVMEELIRLMEQSTDALVIDQVNNPGGVDLYMYGILSCLADKPLKLPLDEFVMTQEEILDIVCDKRDYSRVHSDDDVRLLFEGHEKLYGFPVDYEHVKGLIKFGDFLINQWERGKRFTDKIHPYCLSELNPDPRGHYTKPILMLVNGLSISCGDFAPAILQDNKRAVIFGSRTSGAGGAVEKLEYKNPFGIMYYSITVTLAERLNQEVIENLGVTPDIPYAITERDLTENFCEYVDAVNQAVNSILP